LTSKLQSHAGSHDRLLRAQLKVMVGEPLLRLRLPELGVPWFLAREQGELRRKIKY